MEANIRVLKAGWNFGETTEILKVNYEVAPAKLEPGTYRNITGNQAAAWGLLAAADKAKLQLFLGSYPITPASDILHELSQYKNFGVKTFQAEDEIAGVTSAIGASFAGSLSRNYDKRTWSCFKNRGARACRHDRIAFGDHQCSARRTKYGSSHKNRTSRSPSSALRQKRRSAYAGSCRFYTLRLFCHGF